MIQEKEKESTPAPTDVDSQKQKSISSCDSNDNTGGPEKSISEAQDKLKGRHFWYVVYPDSAPEDWIEQLRQTGLTFCVSPLHDKDTNPDGTPKKPHWHVIISWGNTTTYRSARTLCETILHCPPPQMLTNPTGAYRYHQHLDNPEKYMYEEKSKCYNGWVRPLDSNEVSEIKAEIHRLIYLEDIQEYGELITVCAIQGPEYVNVAQNHTYYCERLCASYRNNPLRGLMRFYNTLDNEEERQVIFDKIKELEEDYVSKSKCKY